MLASILRTVVPFVVGLLLSLLVRAGLDDLVDIDDLTELVTLVVTLAYYFVFRLLERVDSRFGWLLGWAAQPKYPTPAEQAKGLEPVPPSEAVPIGDVVARVDPKAADVVIAGPASPLPDGTPVLVGRDYDA